MAKAVDRLATHLPPSSATAAAPDRLATCLPEDLSARVAACLSYYEANALRAASRVGRRIGNELEVLDLEGRQRGGAITPDIAVFHRLKQLSLYDMRLTGACEAPVVGRPVVLRQNPSSS